MTIVEFYKKFVEELRSVYDERESATIADWIFESIADSKRSDRVTNKEKVIDNSTLQQLNGALQQLMAHKPVQYVLGEAWFYKMKLKVNEDVLIPRPETEELVEWIVEEHKIQNLKLKILDIGTGSGCIAIALKKKLPGAPIFAVDVSKHALGVAKQNAIDQETKINFLQLDFLNEETWAILKQFDIIVSNPPYIPGKEKSRLAKNVVEHEPHIALFVSDEDAFIFYRKIAAFAGNHLKENGKIFVEVHEDFSDEVQQIFSKENFKTESRKDMYGRERMIKAYKSMIS